jgi:hypothetical protein
MRFAHKLSVFVLLIFPLSVPALAQAPPNGTLEVAYRQRESSGLSDSVHLLSLTCFDGNCTATTLTVNQCVPWALPGGGSQSGFYPKVEQAKTVEQNLTVHEMHNSVLSVEERHAHKDGIVLKYRFGFTTYDNADLSRQLGLKTIRYFQRVTTFSGSAVKDSSVMNKVLSWELVPVRGRPAIIEPKCKIAVFGLSDP